MSYDSEAETRKHIKRVSDLLMVVCKELINRSIEHDMTKLSYPEKELFDEFTPALKALVYGSEEYNETLKRLGVALDHHYENNRHHPQYFQSGINGMTLIDLLEMFCDWKAASERHTNGDILNSITINSERFQMSEQLTLIFKNTAEYLSYESGE